MKDGKHCLTRAIREDDFKSEEGELRKELNDVFRSDRFASMVLGCPRLEGRDITAAATASEPSLVFSCLRGLPVSRKTCFESAKKRACKHSAHR